MQSINCFEVSSVKNSYNRYILYINKNKESFCRFCGVHERNTKRTGSQRSAKLLPKISKGFAVFVEMSINVL